MAFFGGSFDPPHLGHIAVARAAQQALALDQVLFAPVGLQPLKPSGSSASFQHRAAMTQLAIAHHPGFELSLLDAPKTHASSAPNYTVDTLARLRHTLPPGAQLFLLLGADSFRTFHQWRHAAEIPFLAGLVVASRPGEDLIHPASMLPSKITAAPVPNEPDRYSLTNPAGDHAELIVLPNLNYDISATHLRNEIQSESPTAQPMLDPAVLAYIHQHHLYA